MNIQLPDKFYKFLVFLSLILIGFVYMKHTENSKREITSIYYRNSLIDSLEINKLKEEQIKQNLIEYSTILSSRNSIKNPISKAKDSKIYFNRIITSENIKEVEVNDLIDLEWTKFENQQNKILLLQKRINQVEEENKIANKLFEDEFFLLLIALPFIAGVLLAQGIKSWYKQEKLLPEASKDKNLSIFERCQSCYKKFSTIRNYSKNRDQSINYAFCDQCFKNGSFTEKYKKIEDLYAEIDSIDLKEYERKDLKNKISKLDRWKSNEY